MNGLPNDIFQKWGHSFEEDTGDMTVYRPTDYEFPRARGRAGIEFSPDGRFTDWLIAPTDAQHGIDGQWRVEAPGRVHISFEGNVRPPRVLEIIQCDPRVLKVQQHLAPS